MSGVRRDGASNTGKASATAEVRERIGENVERRNELLVDPAERREAVEGIRRCP
jgi:hypothetical protein